MDGDLDRTVGTGHVWPKKPGQINQVMDGGRTRATLVVKTCQTWIDELGSAVRATCDMTSCLVLYCTVPRGSAVASTQMMMRMARMAVTSSAPHLLARILVRIKNILCMMPMVHGAWRGPCIQCATSTAPSYPMKECFARGGAR